MRGTKIMPFDPATVSEFLWDFDARKGWNPAVYSQNVLQNLGDNMRLAYTIFNAPFPVTKFEG